MESTQDPHHCREFVETQKSDELRDDAKYIPISVLQLRKAP